MSMEYYVPISHLNDFLFCPKSVYYHNLYASYASLVYKDVPQILWTKAHATIDEKTYSTSKDFLCALSVYSQDLGVGGKIDIYNKTKKQLIERKKRIKKVYQWYVYQLRAQCVCLQAMGYEVESLCLYSMEDNKRYMIPLPSHDDTKDLKVLIQQYKEFDAQTSVFQPVKKKCTHCIYKDLCDACIV